MGKTTRFAVRLIKSLAIALILAIFVQTAIVYLLQDRIIYHRSLYPSHAAVDLFPRALVELHYVSGGAPQIAFYAPPGDGSVPDHIWVFYSGNGGKVLEYGDMVSQPALAADGFLLVDYPGYGFNGGTPSPEATQASTRLAIDALAAHLSLSAQALEPKLNAAGHSLGTGAALRLAVEDPAIRHVVLIAPFTSLCDMARRMLGYPVCILVRYNMDNEAELNVLAARDPRPSVTLFNGTADSVIPPAMGRALAEEHPGWIDYHSLAGAGHIDIVNKPRVEAVAEAMAAAERAP